MEPCAVEGKGKRAARPTGAPRKGSKRPARTSRHRRQLRLVGLVGLVAISVYLYYRPLASYFSTRDDLASQRTSLVGLEEQKSELQLRLLHATSTQATEREARRIGYVRPGEQLFIVKGIPEWRRAHHSVRGSG